LNSKELALQRLVEEEKQLKDSHGAIFEKLGQLRREEALLNKEAERLHRLLIARKKPMFNIQPSNQVVVSNPTPSGTPSGSSNTFSSMEMPQTYFGTNSDFNDAEINENDERPNIHSKSFNIRSNDNININTNNNSNNNYNNARPQFGTSMEYEEEDEYEI